MKLVKQSYELLEQEIPVRKLDDYSGSHFREEYIHNMYKHIEKCGRVCYKSLDRITDDSAEKFVKGLIKSGHCYTGDSEVFTDKGWIKWKDYNGEKVAAINSDLSFKGFEIPERIIKYEYSGNYYEYPELGIKVTDGHNMLGMFRDSKHNFYNEFNYEKFTCGTPYKDNNGRSKTLGERTFKTPVACQSFNYTDPYYELVGFWLGDGCHSEQIVNKLKFHLKKERKINYLKSLCEELGYGFEICKSDHYSVNCPNIGRVFNSLYYENNNKKIEENNLTPLQIHSVIQGLIKSDGNETTTNSKSIFLSTTSESIKNWVLRFGALGGYNITYSGVKNFDNPNWKPSYKLHFIATKYIINNDSRKKNKKVNITNETNTVYCVTVSTGLILVRGTNLQTSICGNCSVLEHGVVYLRIPEESIGGQFDYDNNQYSEVVFDVYSSSGDAYVTTNYRVIVENGWEDDLQYLCEPTEYHEKRHTVLLHTCIHTYKDLTRHRKMSFSISSTRFIDSSNTKRFGDMEFVRLPWMESLTDEAMIDFNKELLNIQALYTNLVKIYHWQPQQAAEILPQCTAADVVMSGFDSDWEFVFRLRSDIAETGKPHPLVEELMTPLRETFKEKGWIKQSL